MQYTKAQTYIVISRREHTLLLNYFVLVQSPGQPRELSHSLINLSHYNYISITLYFIPNQHFMCTKKEKYNDNDNT